MKSKKRITSKKKIAIIGLGRVGLPLALILADKGYVVFGIDSDNDKKEKLTQGIPPFFEEGLNELLVKHIGVNFRFADYNSVKSCQAVIITIGTQMDSDFSPRTNNVYGVIDQINKYLKKDTLIVLRSTVEPKGTEKTLKYIKNNVKKNVLLVYAPERLMEGKAIEELLDLPQIIGSFEKKGAKKAKELFKSFAPSVIETDTLTAELAKLSLNTYRYSTFALSNELMMIADHFGSDIHKVLATANQGYKRGGIPLPGLAAGPCLVKDSFFLKHQTPFNTMITGSYQINHNLPDYFISKFQDKCELMNSKIALLGLTFKKDIDDERDSLSLKLRKLLENAGSKVISHDPYTNKGDLKKLLKNVSGIFISVDHEEYKKLNIKLLKEYVGGKALICDIWNVLQTNKIFFMI